MRVVACATGGVDYLKVGIGAIEDGLCGNDLSGKKGGRQKKEQGRDILKDHHNVRMLIGFRYESLRWGNSADR